MQGIGILFLLAAAFIFPGIILRTKAFMSGRKGAGILQPWKDAWRLARKGSVYSTTTSLIFQIAPSIYTGTVICAMLLIPFDGTQAVISFKGDFVFFAYLLALGRFFMIISAMDTGSPFEGMGANREALFSLLAEPAFFILLGSFAMLTGYTSFESIYGYLDFSNYFSYILGVLATYLLVQMAMIENSRMPVDDPTTHLELTMIHEVMILDNSGIDMAMIQTSSALKFSIFGALIANFYLLPAKSVAYLFSLTPGSEAVSWFSLLVNVPLFLLIQAAFAIAVGVLESFRARNMMSKNPQFIITLSSIAVIVFFTVLIVTQKFIS